MLALALAIGAGCAGRQMRKMEANAPMGGWVQWQTLEPLVDVAKNHADEKTVAALKEASSLLAKGKARSADEVLSAVASGPGRHWVAVARADLLSLHFTRCIRGVAWRIEDLEKGDMMRREIDFDPNTVIEAGDISVEATLTNLDAAIGAGNPALATQGRIARARMTTFVTSCAPNDDVAEMASGILRTDLATLAAENHLTPDLAYVWAGVQMNEYSGAAAKPFLLQAAEGGFDDPSVPYLLAAIALENREYDEADRLAVAAAEVYAELGDTMQEAQCHFLRGEVAREQARPDDALPHYEKALEKMPAHVAAMVGVAQIAGAKDGPSAAAEALRSRLPALLYDGVLSPEKAVDAAANIEGLVIMTDGDMVLSNVARDALLDQVDLEPDPVRRGIRYFYAATLDVRLGDYESARGHAATAETEFQEADIPPPLNVREFLDRLGG